GGHGLRDAVEVAGADLPLVAGRRVAVALERELVLLQPDIRAHAFRSVAPRQLEHRLVEGVEAGERDELEAVAEPAERRLEGGDLVVAQMPAPVERRRAVVGEQLAGEALVDRLRELTRLAHVRGRRLEPEDVRVRRVRARTGDRGGEAVADAEEALGGAVAGDELGV